MSNINIDDVKIRLATKDDEFTIKRFYKESKNEIGSFNLFFAWDDYLSKKSPYNFYMVEHKQEIVGFMRFGFYKRLNSYVVKEVAIDLTKRGMGFGKIFMMKMPKPIYLTCNDDNASGNAFYESIGMVMSGKKKNKSQKWTRIWIMR